MAFIFPEEAARVSPLKRCARCETLKSLTCFVQRKSGKREGHFLSYCKDCNNQYGKRRYRADPDVARANARRYQKQWRKDHPDLAKAQWARARKRLLAKNPNHWRDLYWKYRPRKLISMRLRYKRRCEKKGAPLFEKI